MMLVALSGAVPPAKRVLWAPISLAGAPAPQGCAAYRLY